MSKSLKDHFASQKLHQSQHSMMPFLRGEQVLETSNKHLKRDKCFDLSLRKYLNEALEHTGKSRDDLGEEMSKIAGQKITARHLDSYTGSSRQAWHFPVKILPAVMKATKDETLFQFIAQECGFVALPEDMKFIIDLGLAEAQRLAAQKSKTQIAKKVSYRQLADAEKRVL